MTRYILIAFILLAGCVEDTSPVKLVKTEYFWLSGPSMSVDKLQSLYDLDKIAEDVAAVVKMPVAKGNITILSGWDFVDECPGEDWIACTAGDDLYFQAGTYNIHNGLGLDIAHEMAHLYTRNEIAAHNIACEVFPMSLRCNQPFSGIR